MSDITLNITFTQDQLNTFSNEGQSLVIAKSLNGAFPNVAWQVFTPLKENVFEWTEEYGIYASTNLMNIGAELTQLSNIPISATQDEIYTLENDGTISDSLSRCVQGSYNLLNRYRQTEFVTVGLFQDATVNGNLIKGNAVSAIQIPQSTIAVMNSNSTIHLWIQSGVESNTVVDTPQVSSGFVINENTMYLIFDSSTGLFKID
jgi:hypothetical protein